MAFYILIFKDREDEDKAIYQFGPNEEELGTLVIYKQDGNVEEVVQAPVYNSRALFERAAAKVHRHWRQGELPRKTIWAS